MYGWLEFVTVNIPVLATCGYMAYGGSSWLYVGMSDWPRWNSLLGVNRDKILCYLSYSQRISTWLGQTRLTRKEFQCKKRVSSSSRVLSRIELKMRSYDSGN